MSYQNVYVVNEFESNGEEKSNWTKVGAAFPHESGNGFNIQINDGLSVSGKLVILPPKEKEKK